MNSIIAGAESDARIYSYDELVAEFPETNQPTELWDGKVVMSPAPSFEHQEIVFRLHSALAQWITPRKLGKVVSAPIDMVLSSHRVVQPDIALVATDRLPIIQHAIMGPADLVVEVVSLGGRHRDRIEKRDLYEQYGVKEYWIVDPEARTIDVLVLKGAKYELSGRSVAGQTATSLLLPGFAFQLDH